MIPVLVGISSALIFGAADFLGGLGSKRISPVRVTAIAAVVGLAVLLLAYPVIGGAWSLETVLLGALSGITGTLAIVLLYTCLAIGPMSILSPLTAVVSAIVPLTVGLLQGERLGSSGYVAIGLALVAVVLVGFVRERNAVRPTLRGLVMATASGTMIGLFLVIMDRTATDSGLVPLLVNRAVNATLMFATVGVLFWWMSRGRTPGTPHNPSRGVPARDGRGWRPGLRFAVACGIVDAIANAGLLLGLRIGDLSVMSVLTALYPAGTIVLAAIVLKERIAVVQYVGLALAVSAGALFALA
jgi:drug/metabolite transporter (DMT)-like permease